MLRSWIIALIITVFPILSWGQGIAFKAKANKTSVSVNERFVVQFVLTYGQDNIKVDRSLNLPDFDGLHQLGESQINSFQFVNGTAINQSGVEVILVADREGEYTIKSTQIVINGKKYRTDPITISVKNGLKAKATSGQRLQGAFITTEVTENNPFLNQEIIMVVKAYVRDYSLFNRLRNYQEPDFNDLVVKYVSEKPDHTEKQVLINGVTYISKELARYVVFPQKVGPIEIDPFSIDVIISGYYGSESASLTSEPIELNVKNLPPGKPKNFSGAVGEFSMNASLSKESVKANESVSLEIEIIGSGNLNTLKMPEINFPENLEIFAPKKREAIEARPGGMRGKLVEDKVLVPQYGGDYQIGPINFSYFNPEQNKYINLQSKSFHLEVDGPLAPQKDSLAGENALATNGNGADTTQNILPEILPEKINQVKEQVVNTVTENNNWLWVLGAVVGLPFIWLLFGKRNETDKKPTKPSQKQIDKQFNSEINQKLTELKSLSNKQDQTAFLSLQEEILTQMGMHFSSTQLADFTEEYVTEKLQNQYGELAEVWKKSLLDCKQSKYAFGLSATSLEEKLIATVDLWKIFSK